MVGLQALLLAVRLAPPDALRGINIGLWSNGSAHRIIVSSTANQVYQRAIYRLQKFVP
jgi:hypothetical protein